MVSLHDANGAYVSEVVTDYDLSQATNRDFLVAVEGRLYAWNQRNSQWREVAGVIEPSKPAAKKSEPEPAAEVNPWTDKT